MIRSTCLLAGQIVTKLTYKLFEAQPAFVILSRSPSVLQYNIWRYYIQYVQFSSIQANWSVSMGYIDIWCAKLSFCIRSNFLYRHVFALSFPRERTTCVTLVVVRTEPPLPSRWRNLFDILGTSCTYQDECISASINCLDLYPFNKSNGTASTSPRPISPVSDHVLVAFVCLAPSRVGVPQQY